MARRNVTDPSRHTKRKRSTRARPAHQGCTLGSLLASRAAWLRSARSK